jgi:hypothetical protein
VPANPVAQLQRTINQIMEFVLKIQNVLGAVADVLERLV